MRALLFSAGLGTRLRPYTNHRPKPAIPFLGLPLMYYNLYHLKMAGVTDIVVNVHYHAEQIQQLLKRPELSDFNFHISHEIEKPLGNAGGIDHARSYFSKGEDFITVNSDALFVAQSDTIINDFIKDHKKNNPLCTLWLTKHPELQKTLNPVWVDENGFIKGFGIDIKDTDELEPYHFTGYQAYNQRFFDILPQGESNLFYEVLTQQIKEGQPVRAFIHNCSWWETGDFDNFLKATADFIHQQHKATTPTLYDRVCTYFKKSLSYKTAISEGVTSLTPQSMNFDKHQLSGIVFVDNDVELNNHSVKNAIINKKSVLTKNSANEMVFSESV